MITIAMTTPLSKTWPICRRFQSGEMNIPRIRCLHESVWLKRDEDNTNLHRVIMWNLFCTNHCKHPQTVRSNSLPPLLPSFHGRSHVIRNGRQISNLWDASSLVTHPINDMGKPETHKEQIHPVSQTKSAATIVKLRVHRSTKTIHVSSCFVHVTLAWVLELGRAESPIYWLILIDIIP